jgi:hypothetical protein
MIVRSRAECENKLEVSLLVASAPIKVGLGVRSRVRGGGCTVNHVPYVANAVRDIEHYKF